MVYRTRLKYTDSMKSFIWDRYGQAVRGTQETQGLSSGRGVCSGGLSANTE